MKWSHLITFSIVIYTFLKKLHTFKFLLELHGKKGKHEFYNIPELGAGVALFRELISAKICKVLGANQDDYSSDLEA